MNDTLHPRGDIVGTAAQVDVHLLASFAVEDENGRIRTRGKARLHGQRYLHRFTGRKLTVTLEGDPVYLSVFVHIRAC
jgi:hypothetical protein